METANKTSNYFEVAPHLWGIKDTFVNVFMIQSNSGKNWVLVDAGLKSSAKKIKKMAEELFPNPIPTAILLTHGHSDHVGSLLELVQEWNVPVYAHRLEFPYLTGKSSYPPADPTVGGGLMALASPLMSNSPLDLQHHLHALPDDHSVPGLKHWRYLFTPGHAPGHVSFYREKDKVLIAGDAFVTTKQESAWSIMTQEETVSRPPAYFTYDWHAARKSVKKLAALEPEVVATGHGKPMHGEEMRKELRHLSKHFDEFVPEDGRYVDSPAIVSEKGVNYLPPKPSNAYSKWAVLSSVGILAAAAVFTLTVYGKKNSLFS